MPTKFPKIETFIIFVYIKIEMSPKTIVEGGYTIYWFSNEEDRIHVHVKNGCKKAEFWMEPEIELQSSWGFNMKELGVIIEILRKNEQYIKDYWKRYFNC